MGQAPGTALLRQGREPPADREPAGPSDSGWITRTPRSISAGEIALPLLRLAGGYPGPGQGRGQGAGEALIACQIVLMQRLLEPAEVEALEEFRRTGDGLVGPQMRPASTMRRYRCRWPRGSPQAREVPVAVAPEAAPAEFDRREAARGQTRGQRRGFRRGVAEKHAGIGRHALAPRAPDSVAGRPALWPTMSQSAVSIAAIAWIADPRRPYQRVALYMSSQRASGSSGSRRSARRRARGGRARARRLDDRAHDRGIGHRFAMTAEARLGVTRTSSTSWVPSAFSSTRGRDAGAALRRSVIFALMPRPCTGRRYLISSMPRPGPVGTVTMPSTGRIGWTSRSRRSGLSVTLYSR